MSHHPHPHLHANQFLLLDTTRKPTIRKGVDYQAFVPVALPPKNPGPPLAEQIPSEILKAIPEMGPFNRISIERLHGLWPTLETPGNHPPYSPQSQPVKPPTAFSTVPGTSPALRLANLKGTLAAVDDWISRCSKVGTENPQVPVEEVDALLAEANGGLSEFISAEEISRLQSLMTRAVAFSAKVRRQLDPAGEEKVAVKVLADLLREAEELPVETHESRFLRDQKEKLRTLLHQNAQAERSLDKFKDLTADAQALRVRLHNFQTVIDSVAVSEWAQKAQQRLEKRGPIPLSVVESLISEQPAGGDNNAMISGLKKQLADMKQEGQQWQILAGKISGKISTDDLFDLQDAHHKLHRVAVPTVFSAVDALAKKTKLWLKKVEKIFGTADDADMAKDSVVSSPEIADAKALLIEGDSLATQLEISHLMTPLKEKVDEAEAWGEKAAIILRKTAKREVTVMENLVGLMFPKSTEVGPAPPAADAPVAPPVQTSPRRPGRPRKRPREEEINFQHAPMAMGSKEETAARNYLQVLGDLEGSLARLPGKAAEEEVALAEISALLANLPTLRDTGLEEKLEILADRAEAWGDKSTAVLSAPFPRPVGILRSLVSLLADLAAFPLKYEQKEKIIAAAKFEVWAAKVLTEEFCPVEEADLDALIAACPLKLTRSEDGLKMEVGSILPGLDALHSMSPVEAFSILSEASAIAASDFASIRSAVRDESVNKIPRSGEHDRVTQVLEIVARLKNLHSKFRGILYTANSAAYSRSEWENALGILSQNEALSLAPEFEEIGSALHINAELESEAENLAESLARSGQWQRLQKLRDACDKALVAVRNFQVKLRPVLQIVDLMKSEVSAVFPADGPAPSLESIEKLRAHLLSQAAAAGLSTEFLADVPFVGNALKAHDDAVSWLQDLSEYFENRDDSQPSSLASLRKLLQRGTNLSVTVPLPPQINEEEISEVERFWQSAHNRTKRKRTTLAEVEELLQSKVSLVTNSSEFLSLAESAEKARELRAESIEILVRSAQERQNSDARDAPIVTEISNILKEARKSSIRVGTEGFLERELHCRSLNKFMHRVISLEGAGLSLDAVEAFVAGKTSAPEIDEEDDDPTAADLAVLANLEFDISRSLVASVNEKIQASKSWKAKALAAIPGLAEEFLGEQRYGNVKDASVFDAFFYQSASVQPSPQQLGKDYAYPLPVLEFTANKKTRKKETSPPPGIYGKVPWVNPVSVVPSLDAIVSLASKSSEEKQAEKVAFITRISKPLPLFEWAIQLLFEHRSRGLLLMPEWQRLRGLTENSLRFVRTAVSQYPWLHHRSKGAGDAWEAWEEILVPADNDAQMTTRLDVNELVSLLLESDQLKLQVPLKRRILDRLLQVIDWRIRAQCLAHNFPENHRPRPWRQDSLPKCVDFWAYTNIPGCADIFECPTEPQKLSANVLQAATMQVVTVKPPKEYIFGNCNLAFFYVAEGLRHFARVFSDMCELCCAITTAESDFLFWITCDNCERWFHGPCAALVEVTPSFTCPQCTIASAASSQAQRQAAMAIIATASAGGPKRMGPPLDALARIIEEAKASLVVGMSEPPELAILQKTYARRAKKE